MSPLLPLFILSASLVVISHLVAGDHAIEMFGLRRLLSIAAFPAGFLLSLALVLVIQSIFHVKRHQYPGSGQINVAALWRSLAPRLNPLTGSLVMVLMGYGISGTGDLNEIYRTTATNWLDAPLWQWEAPLFSILRGSWIDYPGFWDRIYFLLWGSLFVSHALVFHAGKLEKFLVIAFATIIAFYLTRTINLYLPTMGPAFWRPGLFDLDFTGSGHMQHYLRLYMMGGVQQNGLIPATMAMPSLHVCLATMAAWALAGERRWTLWLSVPWLLLIWTSTVMLGWHYLLDGVGGILVAAVSLPIAGYIVKLTSPTDRAEMAPAGRMMSQPANRGR